MKHVRYWSDFREKKETSTNKIGIALCIISFLYIIGQIIRYLLTK